MRTVTLNKTAFFTGIEAVPPETAFSEFLDKIREYELEAILLAGLINVADTVSLRSLSPDQKIAVMVECRDAIIEAEWILGSRHHGVSER